jgi:hypothetical protein
MVLILCLLLPIFNTGADEGFGCDTVSDNYCCYIIDFNGVGNQRK